jgi:hypothetical protein
VGARPRVDAKAQAVVDAWNRVHHVGRVVTVLRDNRQVLKTVTRTDAFVAGDMYTPVVFVKGIAGYYALDRVSPYDGDGGLFPGYVRAGGDCICEQCGKRYYDHPVNLEFLGTNYIPFLAVLCDGRNVKL